MLNRAAENRLPGQTVKELCFAKIELGEERFRYGLVSGNDAERKARVSVSGEARPMNGTE